MEEVPIGRFGYVKRQTLDWLSSHLSWVASAGLVLLTALFLAGRFLGWFRGDAQVDYVAAHLAYHKWDVQKLEKLIKRHPELHTKYDAPIAQKLLSSSESGLASGYASATLRRVGDASPYYTQFAQGSLMIADGKLSDALEEAKHLKAKMEGDSSFWEKRGRAVGYGSLLYAYNLLRIAMLEKSAGTPQGELAAWQEFKKNAPKYDSEAYFLLQQNFQKQNISLSDYIQYRETLLTSKQSP